jgi:cobalt/nickel transport system permease protein
VAAATATALELVFSGTSALGVALPAMIGVHVLIGIGEALITVGALVFVQQVRPDLAGEPAPAAARGSGWIAVGLLIALAVALISPLASPEPDGLERVALDLAAQGQFDDLDSEDVAGEAESLASGQPPAFEILPDYTVPFIEDTNLSTIASGIIGVLIVAGVGYGVARLSRRGAAEQAAQE